MSASSQCPFCSKIHEDSVESAFGTAVAFEDGFPISPGHTLVIPKRHEADFFMLTADEQADIWTLVGSVKAELSASLSPDGFNIGINNGVAAGQTVPHCHIHIIPRFAGDREDPRGGVRWILPGMAKYWDE